MSFRAVEVLGQVDYILCEDTRTSRTLLDRYEISKPLKSHHKFNENESLGGIIRDLHAGQTIALISDAGTPGICDPGALLVSRCVEEGIKVSAIPGPSALIMALSLSGLPTEQFQFVGFLPKTKGDLSRKLGELLSYPGTSICYESPHRLVETLELLPKNRKVCVVREMTKIYEEAARGTAEEVLIHFQTKPPRGEIVLLIQGEERDFSNISPKEHVEMLQEDYGLSTQDAIKLAATLRGVPKRDIYKTVHDLD